MNLINFVFVTVSCVLVSSSFGVTGVDAGANDFRSYYDINHVKTCKVDQHINAPTEWITMVQSCSKLMMQQVQKELNASLTYLAMGAHFARDTVNRPGFAKFFFTSASEEREHAIKFISYLSMRGDLLDYTQQVLTLIPANITSGITKMTWPSAADAVQDALRLEALVTESIRQIIIECEQGKESPQDTETVNDYHLSDWLTGEFLDEQYKGQRKLAGLLSTLRKLEGLHGRLGEWLVDKDFA